MSSPGGVEAVIFDWGGTLTPWHDVDFDAEAAALARAVVGGDAAGHVPALLRAGEEVWGRARDEHRSATVADVFAAAGLEHDVEQLHHYRGFWEPHTATDPDVRPLWEALRADGVRVGVLSNTIWPRAWHEAIFARDDVLHLIDGDVYSSEVPWTKPAPEVFHAAVEAVGVRDPGRCVFVGDRLFDDVWGAQQAGLRAIHVPHSRIPAQQRGHSEGEPDAVVERLADVHDHVRRWR